MSRRFTRGFTLIELLVVIAIIGILASVVLVSLQSARKKGNDSRVISSVQQMRIEAESKYDGSDYDVAFNQNTDTSTVTAGEGLDTTNSAVALQLSDDATKNGAYLFAVTNNAAIVTSYAIYGSLPSTNNVSYFCIDSEGRTNPSTTDKDDTNCSS